MNLNCLTCQKILRTDSKKEFRENAENGKENFGLCAGKIERIIWLWNLSPRRPSYEKMRSGSTVVPTKKSRHRIHSNGSIVSIEFNVDEQPKLARSCGMRRDWSFEDLRQQTLKA